jgi:hypothetical protein
LCFAARDINDKSIVLYELAAMYEIGFNMREGVIIFLQDENIYDTYILDVLYLERVFTGFLLVLI